MSTKIAKQECGCEVRYEPISRSLHIREIWGQLCPTHDAEEKALRAEAKRGHDEHARMRALEEEFT